MNCLLRFLLSRGYLSLRKAWRPMPLSSGISWSGTRARCRKACSQEVEAALGT